MSAPKKRRTTKASSKDLVFVEVEYDSGDAKKRNKKKAVGKVNDDDEDYVDDNEGSTVEMVRVFLSGQCMLTLIWIPSPLTLISPNSRFRGKQLRVIAGSPS